MYRYIDMIVGYLILKKYIYLYISFLMKDNMKCIKEQNI